MANDPVSSRADADEPPEGDEVRATTVSFAERPSGAAKGTAVQRQPKSSSALESDEGDDERSPGAARAAALRNVSVAHFFVEEHTCEEWADRLCSCIVGTQPMEVAQLKSLRLRLVFRFLLVFGALGSLVALVVTSYHALRQAEFLAVDRSSGDCRDVSVGAFSETYTVDWQGRWSTEESYDETQTFLRVRFVDFPADQYARAMHELAEAIDALESGAYMENVLRALAWKGAVAGGKLSANFVADPASLFQLSSMTFGATGCPSARLYSTPDRTKAYDWGYRHRGTNDMVYEYDVENLAESTTRVSWSPDALTTCVAHREGQLIESWLESDIPSLSVYYAPTHSVIGLDVNWASFALAAAINTGVVDGPHAVGAKEVDASRFTIAPTVAPSRKATVNGTWRRADDVAAYEAFMASVLETDTSAHLLRPFDDVECPAFAEHFLGAESPDNEPIVADVRYFVDSDRFPGMEPLACVDRRNVSRGLGGSSTETNASSTNNWICSIVKGGAHALPIVFHFVDKCNHCDADAPPVYDSTEYARLPCGEADTESRDFFGGLFVKRSEDGPFVAHPFADPKRDTWSPGPADAYNNVTLLKDMCRATGHWIPIGYGTNFATPDDPTKYMVDFARYAELASCAMAFDHLFLAFSTFDLAFPRAVVNDFGYVTAFEHWHCTRGWADAAAAHLRTLSQRPPLALNAAFKRCKFREQDAIVSSLGESEGIVNIIIFFLAFVVIRYVVRAMGTLTPRAFRHNFLVTDDDVQNYTLAHTMKAEYVSRHSSSTASRGGLRGTTAKGRAARWLGSGFSMTSFRLSSSSRHDDANAADAAALRAAGVGHHAPA